MKYICIPALLLLCVQLLACGHSGPSAWKTIDEKGYIIQYPDSFEAGSREQTPDAYEGGASVETGLMCVIRSGPGADSNAFRPNINLEVEDLQVKDMTLDQYVELAAPMARVVESGKISKDGTEYYKVIFTGNYFKRQLKLEQRYYVFKGKSYVLTFTCEAGQWDSYKAVCEKILDSFRLTK